MSDDVWREERARACRDGSKCEEDIGMNESNFDKIVNNNSTVYWISSTIYCDYVIQFSCTSNRCQLNQQG